MKKIRAAIIGYGNIGKYVLDLEFNMKINNPALTAQVLVCVARTSMKQQPGCYTMIELPVIGGLLYGDKENLIAHLV